MKTVRFIITVLCFLPSLSWSSNSPSCKHALETLVETAEGDASVSQAILLLKVGARDGDASCAALVGILLSDPESARKGNYSLDQGGGYGHLKKAALDSEQLTETLRADVFYWLGRAYFDGEPVLQNFKIAYSWFSLGASLGHPRSSAMRDRTFSLLGQAGMADGVQELALRCKSSPKLCLPE